MAVRRIKIKNLSATLKEIEDEYLSLFLNELGDRVVDKTPVRDGTLRGSNRLSLGSAKASFGPADPSGGGTKSQIKSESRKAKVGQDAYITNGAPYASEIEKGSSQQAPNGFMLRAAMETPQISAKAAKEVK